MPPRPSITTAPGMVPMAEDSTAFVIPLHQVPAKRKKAAAPRKVNRQRRQKAKAAPAAEAEPPSHEFLIPPEFLPANDRTADAAAPLRPIVRQAAPTSLRRKLASLFL